ncbi:hypothetical protein PV797_04265 [Clostridiaceae bacterium M8S5]|nr:hypothetical protein PV797_04265 [Clostridiaceae bacterium M8S5]
MSLYKINNNKKGTIYYWDGASMLLLKNFKSDLHSHYPVDIYIGLDDNLQISFGDKYTECRGI